MTQGEKSQIEFIELPPTQLLKFLQSCNSTLERINVEDLYVWETKEDEEFPSDTTLRELLPFPNLVHLYLSLSVEEDAERTFPFIPDPETVQERARESTTSE